MVFTSFFMPSIIKFGFTAERALVDSSTCLIECIFGRYVATLLVECNKLFCKWTSNIPIAVLILLPAEYLTRISAYGCVYMLCA